MGVSGIGIWQLVVILLIVMMLFGTDKLKTPGSDLGGAVKGLRETMEDDKSDNSLLEPTQDKA